MTEFKPQPRKRTIVGWRQTERRRAEIRSKQRPHGQFGVKAKPAV